MIRERQRINNCRLGKQTVINRIVEHETLNTVVTIKKTEIARKEALIRLRLIRN